MRSPRSGSSSPVTAASCTAGCRGSRRTDAAARPLASPGMRRPKRTLAVLAAVLVIGVPALASAGCGATSHAVGGIVAHKIVNHFVHSAAGRRRVNKVFCLYHGHRVLVDLRTHHVFAAGINAVEAYKSCKGGFGHH